MQQIINLLSGPRNISTALMYAFAQRSDFEVLDEPFYGYYLSNATLSITHPSHDEVRASMQCSLSEILETIRGKAVRKNLFLKGMSHHILVPEPNFILPWKNILLIRHPKKLITSFAKVIPKASLQDIGVKKASEIFIFLKSRNQTPIVIDSDELMYDPRNYLITLCEALEVPFSEKMLQWDKGGIPEDGVWAKHWYQNVHASSGFQIQQKNKNSAFPTYLEPLLEEAMPFYESLQPYVLKNP